ncbi:MAG: ribosomal protein S18-alanine N-acetyltransferase [Acidobacteria bacterium]|nr:ribosomal protein S18-alanine N-acetyltransferase [Acidobacteriota bacterium]MBU4330198.1 ribosomal protein S18-alanine N-acetyltransferase [Acidobacteriota bacterium]MCG2816020.1 ribosomal protein S18-alanine N-acetyltransferase [Candidatus Aminicenantes bacterium]
MEVVILKEKDSDEQFYFRRMVESDIPDILVIERYSFPNPWKPAAFVGEVHNSPISHPMVLVSRAENNIVGYVIYWQIKEEVQINNIALHPNFRGRGLGTIMMKYVFERVTLNGARYIILEVRPSNTTALHLYEKFGFSVLGVRKGYYINPAEDALVMGKTV